MMASDKIETRIKDRYIPTRTRSGIEDELQKAKLHGLLDGDVTPYTDALCRSLWGTSHTALKKAPILNFAIPTPTPVVKYKKIFTSLGQTRVLDAPNLINDFYYNPLCWGGELIYVGLYDQAYAYNPNSATSLKIYTGNIITALAYNTKIIAVSTVRANSQFLDEETHQAILELPETYTTLIPDVNANAFYMLAKSSGCVNHYDLRANRQTFSYPCYEACSGLAFDNSYKLAIGVDSSVLILDTRKLDELVLQFKEHASTIKALSFSPDEPNLIASGGGSHDRMLKIWDSNTAETMVEEKAGAQICSLHWLHRHSIFATEGFSTNRVSCWSKKRNALYNNTKALEQELVSPSLKGRVLFSAQNPKDRTQIITASTDQTLRFWSVEKTKAPPQRTSHQQRFLLR